LAEKIAAGELFRHAEQPFRLLSPWLHLHDDRKKGPVRLDKATFFPAIHARQKA